jgi:hypothetical protein
LIPSTERAERAVDIRNWRGKDGAVKLAPDAAARLMQALDLQEAGLLLMRENLARRLPDASEAEITRAFQQWLDEQPGYDTGNPDVVVGTWPRRR